MAVATKVAEIKENLVLGTEWDKTFPKNEKVDHEKVTFVNHFGITLAADKYSPKGATGKLAGIAVCGPFGGVKEQASGLYAQEMASRGFVTVVFDPSFMGESGGAPRHMASADLNTEDFLAAVDYLRTLDNVDSERVGIIGICGWGGLALNTAQLDTRIKATAVMTMYDLSRSQMKGYFDSEDTKEQRIEKRKAMMAGRDQVAQTGEFSFAGGLPPVGVLPDEAPDFLKQYVDYYKRLERGYHPRSVGGNEGGFVGCTSISNTKLLAYADEIESAVLVCHGENAHSRYMGEDAFKLLKGDNKELMIIPGATHCDLYDNYDYIPFDKLQRFFEDNLK